MAGFSKSFALFGWSHCMKKHY